MAGNWKMHHDHIEALHTVRDLGLRLKPADTQRVDVAVHPPFTDLRTVQSLIESAGIPVALGAQHCNDRDRGALTGEVSPQMLARLGVRYVLVGHSERRQHFHMTDANVAATVRAVRRHQMTPVCCVGETEAEHDAGLRDDRLRSQVVAALDGLGPEELGGLVVAYEPIWAIGTGRAAEPGDAQAAAEVIRQTVADLGGPEGAGPLRILYGGSAQPDNAAELVAGPDVDGLLVGGASLEAGPFVDILRAVAGCYRSLAG